MVHFGRDATQPQRRGPRNRADNDKDGIDHQRLPGQATGKYIGCRGVHKGQQLSICGHDGNEDGQVGEENYGEETPIDVEGNESDLRDPRASLLFAGTGLRFEVNVLRRAIFFSEDSGNLFFDVNQCHVAGAC